MIERAPTFAPALRHAEPGSSQDSLDLHRRMEWLIGERSCRDIALLTGHHPETVRRYRRGQCPSVSFVIGLCDALDANADWLLRGRETPNPPASFAGPCAGILTIPEALRLAAAAIERTPDFAAPTSA